MVANKNVRQNRLFYICLVNHLLRCGKKQQAYNLVFNAMPISNLLDKNIITFYNIIFDKIRPYIEIRKVRVRRTTYLIPFPTNMSRQQHLAAKWLFETLEEDTRKISLQKKLNDELLKILSNQ